MSGQAVIVMLAGVTLGVITWRLVRLRFLSIRYGIGWLIVALLAVLGAPVLSFVTSGSIPFGFTPTGLSLGVVILFLGLVCLQLSISLSGLHHAVQDLAEHAAHVEARLREVEGARNSERQVADREATR